MLSLKTFRGKYTKKTLTQIAAINFLDLPLRVMKIKANKQDLITLKSSCLTKETKANRQTEFFSQNLGKYLQTKQLQGINLQSIQIQLMQLNIKTNKLIKNEQKL